MRTEGIHVYGLARDVTLIHKPLIDRTARRLYAILPHLDSEQLGNGLFIVDVEHRFYYVLHVLFKSTAGFFFTGRLTSLFRTTLGGSRDVMVNTAMHSEVSCLNQAFHVACIRAHKFKTDLGGGHRLDSFFALELSVVCADSLGNTRVPVANADVDPMLRTKGHLVSGTVENREE
ncbi:hypothetical protein ASF19_00310 [Acidovorax sp. Leaf84]|nr:hypothetical protein ASF19_00310 [Acidovorax sp. Leaf84]